ncbi:MAG TPA: hypothetical protein VG826_20805 [Pirellulales bacterium]|nr:hypothetical protein [Pirellulales bacterium]
MSRYPLQPGLMIAVASLLAAVVGAGAAEPQDDEWRPSTRFVSMQPSTAPTPCVMAAPGVSGAPLVSSPAQPAACGTAYREETYTVRRPVIETSYREERYVRYEPVTTFVPQQVDEGVWVDERVVRDGRTTTQLRWVQGGWTVDPATGREYWRLPMLRPVRVKQPDKVQSVRVWKPNVVTISVPKVSYQPRVHVRQVPVQTVRYVEERRVRRVPVGFGRLLAPAGGECSAPERTFVSPPPGLAPPSTPAASPSDPPAETSPASPAPPPSAIPQPAIDPRENVPGPFMLPQRQSDEGKIQRRTDLQPDRVAATPAAGTVTTTESYSDGRWRVGRIWQATLATRPCRPA